MLIPRVIPCLLLKNKGLVKTIKFKDPKYIGDPLNAIKIFNEKEADELIFLDIKATAEDRKPPFDIIEKIASECFMPVCYGGGIRTLEDIKRIFYLGVEKVSISSYAIEKPSFIREVANRFGSQSIVVCIDVKKNILGKYEIVTHNGKRKIKIDPLNFALQMIELGAGELLVNSIDKDGTMLGYDHKLIEMITENVNVPVIACGGAGKLSDIKDVVEKSGASSGAAGSLFVFYGKHRAVLINYPESNEIEKLFNI